MERDEALRFIAGNHRAVLSTRRPDGRPAMTPVTAVVDGEGAVAISTREGAYKVRNLERDPYASLLVLPDGFFGSWVQVEGPASIVRLPDAMDRLVEYYRLAAGEHPDWDEYRAAMERERRVVIRITVTRAGPTVGG